MPHLYLQPHIFRTSTQGQTGLEQSPERGAGKAAESEAGLHLRPATWQEREALSLEQVRYE